LFTKEHQDWEQLILATYLLRQKTLGDKSFWKPYLDLMPDVNFYCEQDADVVLAALDSQLIVGAVDYRDELDEEWSQVEPVL
jgi:hypothetical protein